MTKIYICDHLGSHRTTQQIENWFKKIGHEVEWTTYWETDKGEWCDTCLFAWTEGMLQRAITPETPENQGKDILKGKNVVTYLMDIEMWAGQHNGTDWNKVNSVAYCSKYIYDVFVKEAGLTPNVQVRHIPLTIEMNDWKFDVRNVNGKNIAIIGDMWPAKGAQMIPEFVHQLIRKTNDTSWKVYVKGEWRKDVWRWYRHYFDGMVKDLGLENNIILVEDYIPSIDAWLEDKDYLVTFSMKDAFSLIVGEALAKGIPAYPHNFPGAKDIWGNYVWTTLEELIYRITHNTTPSIDHRTFVAEHYSNEVIMPRWEKILL